MRGVATGRAVGESWLRAYAGVLFSSSPKLGAWLALLTFFSPSAALAGVLALLCATGWARLLRLPAYGEPHLINSLLCGLVLGAFYALDRSLLVWIALLTLVVTLLSSWLAALLWQYGKLPLLSLPFVLACWLIVLANPASATLHLWHTPFTGVADTLSWPWADEFFTALGWLLLVPYPLAGLLIFMGLLLYSRYLAALAVSGFIAGQLALHLFARSDAILIGFNFMLAAMALGGIFAIPSRKSFALALAGGAMAAFLAMALGNVLRAWQLPLLTLPFILAVYLWLGALSQRLPKESSALILLLDAPSSPEQSYENWRLAKVRGIGELGSVALSLPFFGEWQVTQGFDGEYTHQHAWRHALDFEILENGERAPDEYSALEAYYCFGAPLLAPVDGHIAALRNDLPDMHPGQADTKNNWGNFVLIAMHYGGHVLLAHLQQGSVKVQVGEAVSMGQVIAHCGSSGRAPAPHLHLHVQQSPLLGQPTQAFHLSNVLLRGDQGQREFRLSHQAQQGDRLAAAPRDERLAYALRLAPEQRLYYRVNDREFHSLRSELTLLGQARLCAENGASAAFESTPAALGFYDRRGGRSALLDVWLLALGLTPYSGAADCWHDRPAMALWPLTRVQRLLLAALYPLGAACHSTYRRQWDAQSQAWLQSGEHCFRLMPGVIWRAQTRAWITAGQGVSRIELDAGQSTLFAQLDFSHLDGASQ